MDRKKYEMHQFTKSLKWNFCKNTSFLVFPTLIRLCIKRLFFKRLTRPFNDGKTYDKEYLITSYLTDANAFEEQGHKSQQITNNTVKEMRYCNIEDEVFIVAIYATCLVRNF